MTHKTQSLVARAKAMPSRRPPAQEHMELAFPWLRGEIGIAAFGKVLKKRHGTDVYGSMAVCLGEAFRTGQLDIINRKVVKQKPKQA